MKKTIIALVLVLSLLLLSAPYFTGKLVEAETLKMINKMNQSSTEYGSTEIIEYDRGLRKTTARYKYTPPVNLTKIFRDLDHVIFSCDSVHGITGIDYSCGLEGESAYSKFVAEKLEGKDPLSVAGSVSAFGGLSQIISLNQIEGLEVDGATINLPNIDLSIESDTSVSTFQIRGASDAFAMQGNGETVSVGATMIKADFKRVADLLFTGKLQLQLAHFDASGASGETSFKNISVTSTASEHGSSLFSKVLFSIEQATSISLPFESVENLTFGLDVIGLDTQALIEYQELVHRLQQEIVDAVESNTEPPLEAEQMAKLMPALENMLTRGLRVSSRMNATLDGKANEINLDLTLLEPLNLAQLPLFVTDPDKVINNVEVSLNAFFDKALVDNHPVAAILIAKSPLLATLEDNYVLDLKLGKEIDLNGKATNLTELQILLASSLPFQ